MNMILVTRIPVASMNNKQASYIFKEGVNTKFKIKI